MSMIYMKKGEKSAKVVGKSKKKINSSICGMLGVLTLLQTQTKTFYIVIYTLFQMFPFCPCSDPSGLIYWYGINRIQNARHLYSIYCLCSVIPTIHTC